MAAIASTIGTARGMYTGVMTSAGFQCRIYAVDVHRFLLHQQGSNRFEYYTEVNILSVTDSSLEYLRSGWYAFQSVRCC